MPSSPALSAALVAVVLTLGSRGSVQGDAATTSPPPDGRALATELGCAACHDGVGDATVARTRAPALLGAGAAPLAPDFVFTYLGDPVRRRDDIGATRMPDFHLDEAERLALSLYLGHGDRPDSVAAAAKAHPEVDAALGERVYRVLGCGGCHVAGAAPAPVGPDLSREGARVRPGWLEAWLASPRAVRSAGEPVHAGARMPDFRLEADERQALASWLESLGRPFAEGDTTPLTPFEQRRTERFLEDRVACLGCHRIGDEGGRIGPPLDGVGARLRPSFVVEMIEDPARAAPGAPMPHQPMPAMEAKRLARYLVGRGGEWKGAPTESLADPDHPAWLGAPAEASAGAALYARHCAACHGPGGRGDGWNAANLPVRPTDHADSTSMSKRLDDTLFDGIAGGAWVLDGSPRMPVWGDYLTPGQIRLLVGRIRELCRCQGPAWGRDGGPER